MKTKILALLISVTCAQGAAADAPNWLDANARLMDQALSANKNGINPTDATAAIIAAGTPASYTVQAITTAYASCPALEAAVTEAVRNEPNSAYDVVTAVQDLDACPCSADNVWPHTRIESRIRVESRRFEAVGMGVRSNCVAIAANAAAKQEPSQAQAILYASAGDPFGRPGVDRNGRQIIDAVGKVGLKRADWQGTMEGKGLSIQRQDSDCSGDRDPVDEFATTAGWKSTEGNDPKMLGTIDGSCSARAADLVLSDYQNAKDDTNAVEVLNNTAIDIDLAKGKYVLDVYSDGANVPSKTIPLKGSLLSGQSLVLAGNDSAQAVRDRAKLVTGDLDVAKVNALVLRRGGISEVNCDNVPMALGMIASALGDDGEKWLDDTAKEYEQSGDARQIDAVGTVGAKNAAWLGANAGMPVTVVRQDSVCDGDSNSRDDFNGATGWKVDGGVSPEKSGAADGRCVAKSRDLVLSEYQNNGEKYRSVSLFNNTGAAVDLADAGYVLEVYGDGADSPTRTIALKGAMKTGSTFTIADDDAPADVKERANLVSGELNAANINALVLKRLNVGGGRACMASVVAAARDIKLPIELANQPFAPSREPQNGDSVLGRPIGAGIASPN
jgi:hypothetical protein